MQRGLYTGIALGVAMVIFALQNSVVVPVKILWMKFTEVPLTLILLISVLIGVSVTSVFGYIDKQRLRNRIKRLQTRIKEIEDPTFEEVKRKESELSFSDEGSTIEGEPGHKFFDD